MRDPKTKHWYVVRVHFMTEAVRQEIEGITSIRTYVPVLITPDAGAPRPKKSSADVAERRRATLLTFNYAFFYGLESEVEAVVAEYPKMSMLYYRKDNSQAIEEGRSIYRDYMIVSDQVMEMFIKTVSLYQQGAPIADVKAADLAKGDLVRITDGPFEGVEGTLITTKGKDGGKVVISINQLVNISTLDIDPKYIKVIKFANGNKHIYKKFDSYKPFVSEVIARRMEGTLPTESEAERIREFVNRFSEVNTDTVNMEARLKVLLFMSYVALDIKDLCTSMYSYLKRDLLLRIKSERVITSIKEQLLNYEQLLNQKEEA